MIISHNALINALKDYSAFGVVLFLREYGVKYKLVPRLGYNKLCALLLLKGAGACRLCE